MKRFALAAALALLVGSQADAQYVYSYPAYSGVYPATYATPYYGSYYTPATGVITSSYATPAYTSGYYTGGYYTPAWNYSTYSAYPSYAYGLNRGYGWRGWRRW